MNNNILSVTTLWSSNFTLQEFEKKMLHKDAQFTIICEQ